MNFMKVRKRAVFVTKAHENHDKRRKQGQRVSNVSSQPRRTSLQLENGRRVSKKPTSATTNVTKARK